MKNLRPGPQGLYDPQYEHDACGIGIVVQMKGLKSHQVITDSLTILKKLNHRGACGCEENTGDGAGVIIQIPHDFLQKELNKKSIELPKPGEYGVGMLFMTPHTAKRNKAEVLIENIVSDEGAKVIGWRAVPTDSRTLGKTARAVEPFVRQVFIEKNEAWSTGLEFERKLYIIRKRIENAIQISDDIDSDRFFFVSLSSRTLVYKGMLLADQVDQFYPDLTDNTMVSAIAMVHSRFATNTFPNWDRAHPNRYMVHNGEINTLRGNFNWMKAREANLASKIFGDDISKVTPLLNEDGSDSAIFDNCLEFLVLGGRSLSHALMMMIPEPWYHHESMDDARKAFYEYHSCLMEPWDGPASIAATDGEEVVAVLDRNGLRPSRYWVTKDDRVIVSSEVGVLDIPPDQIVKKGRLEPGRMFRVDTKQGRIVSDEEVKAELAAQKPYRQMLKENLLKLNDLPAQQNVASFTQENLAIQQINFGYTYEDCQQLIAPMVSQGKDPLGSMGTDIPLAVLSDKPRLLYDYFKQLFAQVTNPPIDAIREELVTGADSLLGAEGNLLEPNELNCRMIRLDHPMLSNQDMANLKNISYRGMKSMVLPIHFDPKGGVKSLEEALALLFQQADRAVDAGYNILILSDRGVSRSRAAIPALLAVSGLHHHLIRNGRRTRTGLVIETGEAREVHHFCLLLGYGAGAINPYLALDTLKGMIEDNYLKGFTYEKAESIFIKGAYHGIIKVLSKMGISTIASYRGAQIFEAIGLKKEFVNKYFTWTATRIEGVGLPIICEEALIHHHRAFQEHGDHTPVLDVGGKLAWRKEGEFHLFNPATVHLIQKACRDNDRKVYDAYAEEVNNFDKNHSTLRSLLEFKFAKNPIPLSEVESVESICKRFKTGAMSYGSISEEAHATLAIAMNRIGGKSNTGEGGEDPQRFIPLENGDSMRSAIKQVASGRFGVTSHYLVNADEIQIKLAQGAKPGEGGQLPGKKVYPWIAKVRNSTPGVELISPPPHHDIYSIEDLAELIHDLKNANSQARINVKLVSEVGVGTIAAGVAKGHADVVLISGYDGGTGASPITSIQHAGLPWELGLAETHQTLVMNELRDRIVVEADGQLKTGRDVVIAALLGAEEFGFATAPLVVLGCIMMRKCHLGTCPVGVATQDPVLRAKFAGNPDQIVNFMHFIAQEVREYMAKLGFRTLPEMVGRVDKLTPRKGIKHWKAKGVDLSKLLHQPDVSENVGRHNMVSQNHDLESSLDYTTILNLCKPAIERQEKVTAQLPIKNTDRVVGTITGSYISRKYGAQGLPDDTIQLSFNGSAGQSFGAFIPSGMTLRLEGDANDYVGKGLSGGKIAIYPAKNASFIPEDNIIIGNVALYGATSGECYIRGIAGERFCVRNSGVVAVVEGVGDHACEYMTGGRVVVLGRTGRNFAAGMSGGIAYVYDPQNRLNSNLNKGMVALEKIVEELEEIEVQNYLKSHLLYTGSTVADSILKNWNQAKGHFVKVMPKDYKRVLEATKKVEARGLTGDELLLAAFHESLAY